MAARLHQNQNQPRNRKIERRLLLGPVLFHCLLHPIPNPPQEPSQIVAHLSSTTQIPQSSWYFFAFFSVFDHTFNLSQVCAGSALNILKTTGKSERETCKFSVHIQSQSWTKFSIRCKRCTLCAKTLFAVSSHGYSQCGGRSQEIDSR